LRQKIQPHVRVGPFAEPLFVDSPAPVSVSRRIFI